MVVLLAESATFWGLYKSTIIEKVSLSGLGYSALKQLFTASRPRSWKTLPPGRRVLVSLGCTDFGHCPTLKAIAGSFSGSASGVRTVETGFP